MDKAIREYEDPTSDVSPQRAEKDPRLGKIKELERTLAGLQSLYKETYPDVARVRNEIRQLQAMTTEDYIAQYVEQEPTEVEGETRERRKVVDPYKTELLKQREDILRETGAWFISGMPALPRISRNMKQELKGQRYINKNSLPYNETTRIFKRTIMRSVEKKLSVDIAGNLEKKRQGTQMRIIDPARVPQCLKIPMWL